MGTEDGNLIMEHDYYSERHIIGKRFQFYYK